MSPPLPALIAQVCAFVRPLAVRANDHGFISIDDPISGGIGAEFTVYTDDGEGHCSAELHNVDMRTAIEIVAVLRRAAERRVPKEDVSHAAE